MIFPLSAIRRACMAAAGLLFASPLSQAAPNAHDTLPPGPATQSVAAPAMPLKAQTLALRQLGEYGPIALRGVNASRTLNVGVRLDEIVTAAKLTLNFTYSPSLIHSLSHIKITLNDEVVATLPLDKEHAGQPVTRELDLDPRFFTDFNRIGVQLIAHYTVDQCEDPTHSSLWADISPTTTLTLSKASVSLPNSLALIPAPFFDRRDNGRVTLPFVLPNTASSSTLRAAGVVASWLGALASYREARFPVTDTPPADRHAIVFATPAEMPAGLDIPAIGGASISVIDNPATPGRKLLLIAGRNAQELQTAANALVLGKAAMAGAATLVQSVDPGQPRQPYDAPNWAPVDRPVWFKELVKEPQQLQVAGNSPEPIRINLRVPADLYGWNQRSVPLNVKYRYTAPSAYNDSVLGVDINDQLVKSYRLKPLSSQSDESAVSVPLLSGSNASVTNEIQIPAFRVGSNNQLQFRFHIDSQKTGLCAATGGDVARAAIDPDSTIDFSGFHHYAALPNLAFFANSGYPFTRLADLADTAVVIPDAPTARDKETLLTLLGHMGKWTGLPALRVTVTPVKAIDSVTDHNLLVIGTGSAAQWLAQWGKSLPLLIERGRTEIALRDQRSSAWPDWWNGLEEDAAAPAGRAILTAGGPIVALIGFESPYAKSRSVVAITAADPGRIGDVLDALEDPGKVSQVRGDLTIIRQQEIESLRIGERYYVGEFPWYARIWVKVSAYPALMAVAGILAGLVFALAAFLALSRIAARRAGG